MKINRLIAVLTVVAMLFCACGCGGGASNEVNLNVDFKPITSEKDSQLRYNPDRGWRGEAYVNVGNTADCNQTTQVDPAVNVRRFVSTYAQYPSKICQVYLYLTAYRNTETLPEYAFKRIQEVFDCAKELDIKLTVRFSYQGTMHGAPEVTGEASDKVMLAHMKQLKPILEKNAELIHVIEAGFLGVWGEWHSYKLEHDRVALLHGIMDMAPEGIYVQIRQPEYKNIIPKDDPIYKWMGLHDDAFFGWRNCTSAGSIQPGTEVWNQFMKDGAYAPTGGECFWGYEHDEEIDAFDAILQYSAFRQNSFSIFHSFIEDGYGKGYAMEEWLETEITEQWLNDNKITYAPGWFLDKDGNHVKRNAFDFVADYLGYKLEFKNANISGNLVKNGELNVDLNLVNYGFSAAFNMKSSFVVLDSKGKVVSEVKAGEPETWNSRNPEDYNDSELLVHNVKGKIALPKESGKYKLAFKICNSAGEGARVGNEIDYNNNCNIICEFEL